MRSGRIRSRKRLSDRASGPRCRSSRADYGASPMVSGLDAKNRLTWVPITVPGLPLRPRQKGFIWVWGRRDCVNIPARSLAIGSTSWVVSRLRRRARSGCGPPPWPWCSLACSAKGRQGRNWPGPTPACFDLPAGPGAHGAGGPGRPGLRAGAGHRARRTAHARRGAAGRSDPGPVRWWLPGGHHILAAGAGPARGGGGAGAGEVLPSGSPVTTHLAAICQACGMGIGDGRTARAEQAPPPSAGTIRSPTATRRTAPGELPRLPRSCPRSAMPGSRSPGYASGSRGGGDPAGVGAAEGLRRGTQQPAAAVLVGVRQHRPLAHRQAPSRTGMEPATTMCTWNDRY